VQYESESGAVQAMTLYALIRKLEAGGKTGIKLSHHEMERPSSRAPGDRDTLTVKITKPHMFAIKKNEGRESETHKTVFAVGLKKDSFDKDEI
jgi:hypothetical protein